MDPAVFEGLNGKWKHYKDDNFDKFCDKIEMGMIKKKAATSVHPTMHIDGNAETGMVKMSMSMGPISKKEEVKIGVEQDHEAPHGKVKGTASVVPGVGLVMEGHDEKGRTFKSERKIVDGELVLVLNCDGVIAQRFFKKES